MNNKGIIDLQKFWEDCKDKIKIEDDVAIIPRAIYSKLEKCIEEICTHNFVVIATHSLWRDCFSDQKPVYQSPPMKTKEEAVILLKECEANDYSFCELEKQAWENVWSYDGDVLDGIGNPQYWAIIEI